MEALAHRESTTPRIRFSRKEPWHAKIRNHRFDRCDRGGCVGGVFGWKTKQFDHDDHHDDADFARRFCGGLTGGERG